MFWASASSRRSDSGQVDIHKLYVKKMETQRRRMRIATKARILMSAAWELDTQMTNAFSWATSFVRLRSDAPAKELEREEQTRNSSGACPFVATRGNGIVPSQGAWFACGGLSCSIFSLWRFCDLRWKNSQLTYEYFILLNMRTRQSNAFTRDAESTKSSRHDTTAVRCIGYKFSTDLLSTLPRQFIWFANLVVNSSRERSGCSRCWMADSV